MKQAYNEIIARLVESMKQDAPTWVLPWETECTKYPNTAKAIERADAVLNAYYRHERIAFNEIEQGNSYYSPDADMIVLPLRKQFRNTFAYYATKCHETIHSTGDYTRCDRPTFNEFTSFRFGDSRYSKEELTAEIGSCFLCYELGIGTSYAEQNATAYIHNWLSHLNNNPKWIYKAGELASDAVEYILESAGVKSWVL